jgi:UTP--glucose-1-phosphate uridylyltransferase
MKKITKAIIPAAGLGTRFLPQTKAMPKEMLPLIDKPIIQYVVEEAVAAGITDIIIVTGAHKRSVEDHFDHQYQLEDQLDRSGKGEIADQLRGIADMANFIYVRQKGSTGTGTPVLNAAHLLNDEPFLVLFGDDLFISEIPRAVQLVQEYEKLGKSVIAVTPVAKADAGRYGMIDIREKVRDDLFELAGLVEKPAPDQIPSEFASVSGYILTPELVETLQNQQREEGREFYLADAIDTLARKDKVYGKVIEGQWRDVGNKESYLETIVDVALADQELGAKFRAYIEKKLRD